ncbi:MAG: hypothetical protein JWO41_865 [Candidatus Saccharibacteria bacterium]|nr:hypothetical protein [Candidatus Saccharibacteria bacterium]
MPERLSEPDFYVSPHEIVGHDITHRWVDAEGTRYTRVEFADGTVEEFEIRESLARAVEGELNTAEEDVA